MYGSQTICDEFHKVLSVRFIDGFAQYTVLVALLFVYQFEDIRPSWLHPALTEVIWSIAFAVVWSGQTLFFRRWLARRARKIELTDKLSEHQKTITFDVLVGLGTVGPLGSILQALCIIVLTQIYVSLFMWFLPESIGDYLWLYLLAALWFPHYDFLRNHYYYKMSVDYAMIVAAYSGRGSGMKWVMMQAAKRAREAREQDPDSAPREGEPIPIDHEVLLDDAFGVQREVEKKLIAPKE